MIGFGSLWLAFIFLICLALAIARPKPFAAVIGGLGLLLGTYLVTSVVFKWSFPYQTWNVSIYVVFIFVSIFIVSGGLGGLVLIVRRLTRS